ncbi:MAG: nucleotidyltransferase family protein [Alphaproteobacteria bacterium]|jgi:uncharacterized protein|nr:nucleotidyltransferase family protein [Alphaproteobacteria bacterium]
MLKGPAKFEKTAASFIDLACRNRFNRMILERLDQLGAPDAWLVAGCLYQTVWNVLSDRPVTENIKDYDIFYFDASDTSYEAEDVFIKRAETLFGDLDVEVEVRNQARVHLWYEERFGHPRVPLLSCEDGLGSFLVRGTCVAIGTGGQGGLRANAPYGFEDMFDGVLRANKPYAEQGLFTAKAASYAARWPWLRTIGWDDSD